ncbi:UDP-N-acetylmuramoyl-tripeptide--D-alanyl-D-alanine ligase [Flavicella marina]|uniref:UDP-N-acetylmuramoyl-tripeptide--D-alanyl-D- alanine ligase n=1 Tax=Flavicella marina TaxID=1475951 RepID=UPI0012650B78|nr:UDP-N-acetylmuramoyl-tripeptide--D-alanyl-D-alanine ligase [Flavicella marina]
MNISELYQLFIASSGIATDTRKIKNNSIFFALKGANFNGNEFALKAIESGATYAVVDEVDSTKKHSKLIQVKDVLTTLQTLANYHRKKLNIPVIALTGSNGKTTTKELINCVLSTQYTTTATVGNFNNHIGVPLTLLSFSDKTEIGIVEMGANHQKEIELLCSIAEPNFGYITNFGKAHLEGFGGVEGVIKGKSEIYTYLQKNEKTAFVNPEDHIQVSKTENITSINFYENITLLDSNPFLEIALDKTRIKTNLIGTYNFSNIKAAITIGKHFKITTEQIKSAIENYTPDNNRSQIIEKKGTKIILDAYNANPTSMKAALDNFSRMSSANKVVILGDMFELGVDSEKEHQDIVEYAQSLDFEQLHFIGEHFSKVKTSKGNLHTSFEAFSKSFEPTPCTYLIKGSRGMALERTLALFD